MSEDLTGGEVRDEGAPSLWEDFLSLRLWPQVYFVENSEFLGKIWVFEKPEIFGKSETFGKSKFFKSETKIFGKSTLNFSNL